MIIRTPIITLEGCRERLGVNYPDKRRSLTGAEAKYPFIDFSEITDSDDVLFQRDHRETLEEISARALSFAEWLRSRPERNIFIVAHSAFFSALLNVAFDCAACRMMSDYMQPAELRYVRANFN
jgi:broad specificity phosphatase PhoE